MDQTAADRYQTLTNEWQNAEEIVTKLDSQRSNRRKNTIPHIEPIQNSSETTKLSSFRNVFAKISLPTFDTTEGKDGNIPNDVFYDVN